MSEVLSWLAATAIALGLVAAVTLAGRRAREAAITRRIAARTARATSDQQQAEIDLRFRELVAREWPKEELR